LREATCDIEGGYTEGGDNGVALALREAMVQRRGRRRRRDIGIEGGDGAASKEAAPREAAIG
jgi:hypothetical protein